MLVASLNTATIDKIEVTSQVLLFYCFMDSCPGIALMLNSNEINRRWILLRNEKFEPQSTDKYRNKFLILTFYIHFRLNQIPTPFPENVQIAL